MVVGGLAFSCQAKTFAQTFARASQPELILGDLRSPNNAGFLCHLAWQQSSHHPEVAGSNPAPLSKKAPETGPFFVSSLLATTHLTAG